MINVEESQIWNSLEVVKIFVSIITPLVVALVGFKINKVFKNIDKSQWVNKTVIQWKIKAYEEITPLANDIYCFFLYVGNWKKLTPVQIIGYKRELDRIMNLSSPLFSDEVRSSYQAFIDSCFEEYRGKGEDLGLRTGIESRIKYSSNWDKSWDKLFVENKTPRDSIVECYDSFIKNLASDLKLSLNIDR